MEKQAPKDKAMKSPGADAVKVKRKHWVAHESVCLCDKCAAARAKKPKAEA